MTTPIGGQNVPEPSYSLGSNPDKQGWLEQLQNILSLLSEDNRNAAFSKINALIEALKEYHPQSTQIKDTIELLGQAKSQIDMGVPIKYVNATIVDAYHVLSK